MDTEQLIELILREIQAVRSAGVPLPSQPDPRASASVPAAAPAPEPAAALAHRAQPSAKPCSDSIRANPLEACDEALLRYMQTTTNARIGIGKSGPRLTTAAMLRLRADHAAAKDAVLRDVPDELLTQLGLLRVQTLCATREEYLERPDLGRRFSRETLALLSNTCPHGADVQIYAAGGLSSTAVTANLANILPVMTDGLQAKRLTVGKPFFVQYARVPSMEEISETLQPKVVCVLIGERPGLATAESMSAYLAYQATVGMPDSRRTVVSNIHRGGVSAVEAGAYLVELIEQMIQQQASGVDFTG